MLTRGIQAQTLQSGDILSQIEKKQQRETAQKDNFSANLANINANSQVLGEKHLGVAKKYVEGIESMINYYSSNPSDYVKRQINNQIAMANKYVSASLELQNVNNTNLANVLSDETAYVDTTEEAMAKYNALHNTPYSELMFDPEKGVMFKEEEDSGPLSVFQDPYMKGNQSLVFQKRGLISEVEPIGSYAEKHYEKFADKDPDVIEENVREAIIVAAGTSNATSERAIMHYLSHKGVLEGLENEEEVSSTVDKYLSDETKKREAVEWYAGEEAKMVKDKQKKDLDAAMAKSLKEQEKIFSGYFDVNEPFELPSFTMTEDQAKDISVLPENYSDLSEDQKSNALTYSVGFNSLYTLAEPVTHDEAPNLTRAKEEVKAINVGADGNIYGLFEYVDGVDMAQWLAAYKPGSDVELPEDAELKQEFRLIEPGTDIHRTIVDQLGPMESVLFEKSFENSKRMQEEATKALMEAVKAKKEQSSESTNIDTLPEREPEAQTPVEDRVEAMFAPGGSLVQGENDQGEPNAVRQLTVDGSTSYTQRQVAGDFMRPDLKEVVTKLVSDGYDDQQIVEVIKSPEYKTALDNEGIKGRSGLSRGISNVVDAVVPDSIYRTGFQKDKERMAQIASQMIDGTYQPAQNEEAESNRIQSEEKAPLELPTSDGLPQQVELGFTVPGSVDASGITREAEEKIAEIQANHQQVIDSLRSAGPVEIKDDLSAMGADILEQDPDVLTNPVSYVLENHWGLDETNADDQAVISGFFRNAGATALGGKNIGNDPSNATLDQFAWCAALVDSILTDIGGERIEDEYDRIRARSYSEIGEPVNLSSAQLGDIVVIDNQQGGNHVAFFAGGNGDEMFLLGGNQNDKVNIASFPTTSLRSIRRLKVAALSQKERDFIASEIKTAQEAKTTR